MDVRRAALAAGAALLLLGLLGFVPGITTGYETLTFVDGDSEAELFGLFGTGGLHNVLHLALGVAGLWLARTVGGARAFLLGGGAAVLVVGVLSLAGAAEALAGDVPGGLLHVGLGALMLGAAAVTRFPRRGEARARPPSEP